MSHSFSGNIDTIMLYTNFRMQLLITDTSMFNFKRYWKYLKTVSSHLPPPPNNVLWKFSFLCIFTKTWCFQLFWETSYSAQCVISPWDFNFPFTSNSENQATFINLFAVPIWVFRLLSSSFLYFILFFLFLIGLYAFLCILYINYFPLKRNVTSIICGLSYSSRVA
jgi:hypothetical protein